MHGAGSQQLLALTSSHQCKVEHGVSREQAEQVLGLAIRQVAVQPDVELAQVRLQGDAAQPAIQAHAVGAHLWGHVAHNDPQREGNPGCVRVDLRQTTAQGG